MLSADHWLVSLIYRHPVLGELRVDQFQRQKTECHAIRTSMRIGWLSRDLRVAETRMVESDQDNKLPVPLLVVVLEDPVDAKSRPLYIHSTQKLPGGGEHRTICLSPELMEAGQRVTEAARVIPVR
jgi:hypothetical protein